MQRSSWSWPVRTSLRPAWPDLALALILALLPLLFFWRLVTPNPADRLQISSGDFTEQYFPLRAFTARQWVAGEVPLWNPYLFGGQPALADIQAGALYPPHLLQALLLGWGGPLFGVKVGFPLGALQWQVIFHFSVAAVGSYFFARHTLLERQVKLRTARFGGVISALVFTYSGYLTGFPVQQMTILSVSAWLPWVLWGLSSALSASVKRSWASIRPVRYTGAKFSLAASLLAPFPAAARPVALTAVAFALAFLAGHPQTVLYIVYLTLAYAIFYNCHLAMNNEQLASPPQQPSNLPILHPSSPPPFQPSTLPSSSPPAFHPPILQSSILPFFHSSILPFFHSSLPSLICYLTALFLGLVLSAAQLLPTLEFISRSVRADLSYQAVSAGLPLTELVSVLYPGYFGGSPAYVGIAPLVLMALALGLARPRAEIYFWAGAGLVSLLLAFGGNLFVYPLFYLLAPGFDLVRQQERAFLIYSFSAAMLAGYGATVLVRPLSPPDRLIFAHFQQRLRTVALVALAVTALYIYGSTAATARGSEVNLLAGVLRHHLFGLLCLGGMLLLLLLRPRRWLRRPGGMALVAIWVAYNLFTVNWRFNLAPPDSPPPFAVNGVVQFLQANNKQLAMNHAPLTNPSFQSFGSAQGRPSTFPSSHPPILPSSSFPLSRIASGGLLPGGNSAGAVYGLEDITGNTPLQLAEVHTFLNQLPAWRLWQLLNVRYVIAERDIGDPGLQPVFAEAPLTVYEMADPFKRAWFVSTVEIEPDVAQAVRRLADDAFDLRQAAIVAQPLSGTLDDPSNSTIKVESISPGRLSLSVEAAGSHLLVLSQIYDPGWQAELNGQAVDLRRVNAVLQGVAIPPGQYQLELIYRPAAFTLGVMVSAIGLLLCFGLFLLHRVWQ
jgi:hypothetical protein